jgi:hypothetical protein
MAAFVGLSAAVAVLVWGCVHLIRETRFHGFAPSCSDGHPEYDARYCELAGGPSLLHVAGAALVAAVALGALRVSRRSTRVRSGRR